ncbi:MAG: hypothetical protein Q9218_006819 [Villophora microphyllina]
MSSSANSPEIPFRFLDLPYDIRHHLYRTILPGPDVPKVSGQWTDVALPGDWKDFLNLLSANHQIHSEGSHLIHHSNAFTITVSGCETNFLHSKQYACDHRPFPAMSCLRYIRDWQLDLQFHPTYARSSWYYGRSNREEIGQALPLHLRSVVGRDKYYIREAVLAVSAVLAKECNDLDTLIVRAPCLCCIGDWPPQTIHKAITFALKPLQLLRFKGLVKIITAQSTKNRSREACRSRSIFRRITSKTQCLKPNCLALAESFDEISKALCDFGKPRYVMTRRQLKWLECKERFAQLQPGTDILKVADKVWEHLETPGTEKSFYAGLRELRKLMSSQ